MALTPEDLLQINQLIAQYFSANLQTVKLSTLPLASTLEGLHTMGVDAANNSVRVALQFIKDSTKLADDAALNADTEAAKAKQQALLAFEATEAANNAAAITKPLRFIWDGTRLGLKFEGDPDFVYTDLKGATGNSLEFKWEGTVLGIRVEGQTMYTDMELGGKDAYQIALALDPEIGTKEEWIQSIKQPALDAAEAADAARLAIENDLAAKAAHGYGTEPQKTLKEVDDSVSQLAGDVSLLDAVQGAKIKDIENVLSTANLGQSTQVSVSGVSPLSLPKNAANSGMSVKLEGLTEDVGGVITHFEPTGRIRVEDASENEMSRFYLTSPELRSNGAVKDEIRKGANGYELVKRVGSSLYGSEIMSNSGAAGTTDWVDSNADGLADGWNKLSSTRGVCSIVTGNGFTGNAQRYEADATTDYQGITFPLAFVGSAAIGKVYKLKFKYRCSEIVRNSRSEGMVINAPINIGDAVMYETIWRPTAAMDLGSPHFRLIILSSNWIEIDEVSLREIPSADGLIAPTSTFTELSDGTVLYTLATPEISPINYGGILNSAENGTVYHEPVIADAGVYGTNMPILLTDYPIASIEEIIKHENGIDTYLNVASAVVASDGLSFTHPDLTDGDLVLFTYIFNKESTNGNITATFYDSNVVKIDTETGKAYKIEDVITNGVLTRTLTEV